MRHYQIPDVAALHPPFFVQDTDPALDPENNVSPYKGWLDTSVNRLKYRKADNTGWQLMGVEST